MNEAGGKKPDLIFVILHANARRQGVCGLSAVNSDAIKFVPQSRSTRLPVVSRPAPVAAKVSASNGFLAQLVEQRTLNP